ncbi:interferon-induced GTP-binding protein Mx-like [Salarias fasciatus]|uniref:interferon-induced GTP-binding protein Mx-like n=1 Tax=Salarias fasciatus TaxID=181472 RepID=UPI0011768B13|nr:interferon-induced GTP-binding protein Mx-like [Salarias fasciatus]
MSTLNQQYEEKVRPCIDLIDSLRSLGVEKDLALPAIAVIGDQSSGKSSVLEALSGVALPRGSGIVTRCPLELKMKRKTDGDPWFGKISYQNHEEEIKKPGLVEKKIRDAQDKMAGSGVGISDELITLEIASPDVPDLTLIDLPGIARVAVEDQPVNIGDQIKRLIQKFIQKQETISLVVVPCNVDIATTEALKMAQEVDPDGERTVGILTKPDLVDKGTEDTPVRIVHNEVICLKKGYMIVKCRGQKEITDKVSLPEALQREEDFFKEHAHFQILYEEGKATVPKLAEKLTLELVQHIVKNLPHLEEQIKKKIQKAQTQLDRLGSGPPLDTAERLGFLIDKVTEFTQDVICLTKGEDLKCQFRSNIFFKLRDQFQVWKQTIDSSGNKFNQNIQKEVAQYELKYRGRELPGFINYKTFEAMIQDQIKKLEQPAVLKLMTVSEMVKEELCQLAEKSLFGFPNLIRAAKMQIESIRNNKQETAESMLRSQFRMEMVVYTQDSRYSKKLGKRKREDEAARTVNWVFSESEATLKEMMKHIKSYYQIVGQRLADQIPLVIRYYMLQELAAQLHREMLQMIQDKATSELMLHEDSDIDTQRTHCMASLKRLSAARRLLGRFSMKM